MAVRTKAQLGDLIASQFQTTGNREITAARLRSFLTDLIDSLAFLTDVSASGVTESRVNELIGAFIQAAVTGNTETLIEVTYNAVTRKLSFVADNQGAGGGGINLAQAIAAVQVDATAVAGVELTRTAAADRVTIGLALPAVDHLNYIGLSADDVAQASEFTVMGVDHALMAPTIPAGTTRHVVYAKPATEGAFTFAHWYAPGHPNQVNVYGSSFIDGAGQIQLGGEPHVWIRSRVPLPPIAGGRVLEAG